MLYFSVKGGIISSHRDLNSVSSSTDKTNLLGPIVPLKTSESRSSCVQATTCICLKCWRKHLIEIETSGT
jgi:hypothetical protein